MATSDPGNQLNTARRIELTRPSQFYRNHIGGAEDRSDFYVFRLKRQSSLRLTLDDLDANVGLRLLDRQGKTLQRSNRPGSRSESIRSNLGSGTYYLQVYAHRPSPYRLTLAAIADQAGDRRRNARDLGTIGRLSLRDAVGEADPADYYRVQVSERSQFTASLNSGVGTGAQVQLLDRQGRVLQTGLKTDSGLQFINDSLNAGTYYLRVTPQQRSSTRYQLELNATPVTLSPLPQVALVPRASGFNQPVYVASANDGSDRLFVVEQAGQIRIVQQGRVLATPFLDIRSRVRSGGEEGLLSIAFPPNYASKGYFYVYYTNSDGNNVVARYRLSGNPNIADAGSEEVILTLNHPTYANHNGGQLQFGPDGYLYIGTGDGGGGGDSQQNAQNPNSLLGKLLRIDVESGGTAAYRIPQTNPFVGARDPGDRARDEIWALGLRNPWRFSFDRQTGDLYIGDVGQSAYEEVDVQPASSRGGENYGWNRLEGKHFYGGSSGSTVGFVEPVVEYDHSQGESVTGGYVYRRAGELAGVYLYGDFVSGKLWGLRRSATGWESQLLLDSPYQISTFGEDEQGNVYLADYAGGTLYQVTTR